MFAKVNMPFKLNPTKEEAVFKLFPRFELWIVSIIYAKCWTTKWSVAYECQVLDQKITTDALFHDTFWK